MEVGWNSWDDVERTIGQLSVFEYRLGYENAAISWGGVNLYGLKGLVVIAMHFWIVAISPGRKV